MEVPSTLSSNRTGHRSLESTAGVYGSRDGLSQTITSPLRVPLSFQTFRRLQPPATHRNPPYLQMLAFQGISASVRVDDADLAIFGATFDEETRTATCWIPSVAGKNYKLCWQDASVNTDLSTRIYLDGAPKPIVKMHTGVRVPGIVIGPRVSKSERRPFAFSTLNFTEEDVLLDPENKFVSDPGTIRMEMYRSRVVARTKLYHHRAVDTKHPTVNEKTKKAGSHATVLGNTLNTHTPRHTRTAPYSRADNKPWVTFVFRYRPEDVLRAMGIMRTATASTTKRSDGDNSIPGRASDVVQEDELQTIEDEKGQPVSELDARKAALIARRTAAGRVKPESRKAQRRVKTEIEVIDLTMSD